MRSSRFTLWLFFLFLLISCEVNATQRSLGRYLEFCDSLLWKDPLAALDSLANLTSIRKTGKEEAYFNLLLTIARDRNYFSFSDDSLIAAACSWYDKRKGSCDNYNLARSKFYRGLVCYRIWPGDSLAFHYVTEARRIVEDADIQDIRLSEMIYEYLGKIHFQNGNNTTAAEYYEKALKMAKQAHHQKSEFFLYCDIIFNGLMSKDYGLCQNANCLLDSLITVFQDYPESRLYNTKAAYHCYCTHEYDSILFYCHLWKGESSAKRKLMAAAFRETGQTDSAIAYEKKALMSRKSEDSLYYHVYYKSLAGLYNHLGETDSAFFYQQQAYESLKKEIDGKTSKKILELERQYDYTVQDAKLEQMKHRHDMTIIGIVVLLLIIGLLAYALVQHKSKLYIKDKLLESEKQLKEEIKKQNELEIAALNSKLLTEKQIRQILLGLSKSRNLTVNRLIPILNKALGNNDTVADDLEVLLGSLKKEYTTNASDILDAGLERQGIVVQQVAGMLPGAQARAVFIMTELGCSVSEIKEYLSTTAAVVRAVKSSIRSKLAESSLLQKSELDTLRIMKDNRSVGKKQQDAAGV